MMPIQCFPQKFEIFQNVTQFVSLSKVLLLKFSENAQKVLGLIDPIINHLQENLTIFKSATLFKVLYLQKFRAYVYIFGNFKSVHISSLIFFLQILKNKQIGFSTFKREPRKRQHREEENKKQYGTHSKKSQTPRSPPPPRKTPPPKNLLSD